MVLTQSGWISCWHYVILHSEYQSNAIAFFFFLFFYYCVSSYSAFTVLGHHPDGPVMCLLDSYRLITFYRVYMSRSPSFSPNKTWSTTAILSAAYFIALTLYEHFYPCIILYILATVTVTTVTTTVKQDTPTVKIVIAINVVNNTLLPIP